MALVLSLSLNLLITWHNQQVLSRNLVKRPGKSAEMDLVPQSNVEVKMATLNFSHFVSEEVGGAWCFPGYLTFVERLPQLQLYAVACVMR